MKLIDLFSGIGGFSLAASWVFGDDLEIVCFCEKDEFCRRVLKKHWPHVPIVEDVYDLDRIVAYTCKCSRVPSISQCAVRTIQTGNGSNVDVLCAGFPCQPASCAGQRKGTSDDRWLWPPLLAAIQATHPRWLILENVPGLLSLEAGMVFERCLTDLEAQGYEVQPLLIPACGVGAPHKRERVWIVGYSNELRQPWKCGSWKERTPKSDCHAPDSNQPRPQKREVRPGNGIDGATAENPSVIGRRSRRTESEGQRRISGTSGADCDASNTTGKIMEEWKGREHTRELLHRTGDGECWQEHWYSVAFRTCNGRVDDGLSRRLDRTPRLKALGNAVVPILVARIMKAIKEATN